MFKEYNISNYEKYLNYEKELLLAMQPKKNLVSTPLNKQKIKLILDTIYYYEFMYKNGDKAIADNPTQCILDEFKAWKLDGYLTSTAIHTASLANTTTTTTTTTTLDGSTGTAVVSATKDADEALIGLRHGRRDHIQYLSWNLMTNILNVISE